MHAFPRSSVLVLESSSAVSSLIPSTLVDQVDALLDAHRIDDASLLVDQRRKKLEANLTVDPDEAEELDYAYQVIGFKCFSETLFDDAGRNLFNGHLDPRVLVSYFPDLRGRLFLAEDAEDEVDVFAGVAERMPLAKDIDELIKLNLVLNYSPHLSPTSPPSVELSRVLRIAARDMLCLFLEKSRKRARVEGFVAKSIPRVIDTVLAKLYTDTHQEQLTQLISEPNQINLPEIEPILLSQSLYAPLISLYKYHNHTEKLLELYASSSQHTGSGGVVDNPTMAIYDLLTTTTSTIKQKEEHIKWGLWMLEKGEIDSGLKLLIPSDTTQSTKRISSKQRQKDLELYSKISSANEFAAKRFLEYLILRKGYTDEDLHTTLALNCIDEIGYWLKDESVCKLWRAKASSYASRPTRPTTTSPLSSKPQSNTLSSSPPPPAPLPPFPHAHAQQQQQSFLTYFSSTTPNSPSKRARLKTIYILSGSAVYNASVVLERLLSFITTTTTPHQIQLQQVLGLELTILYGKLGNHAKALEILVHKLRDTTSAEMYCNLGGEIVPARIAYTIASSSSSEGLEVEAVEEGGAVAGLMEWYTGLFESSTTLTTASAVVRQKSVKEDVKKGLLADLVGVYVRDATNGMEYTKNLLERQGVNLDVVDIVTLVPDDWQLNSLNTFLSRYFRRSVHSSYENIILKNLSAGQNLSVRERSWPILRSHGYVIEEPDFSDNDGGDSSEDIIGSVEEKQRILSEKVVDDVVVPSTALEKGYEDEHQRMGMRIEKEGGELEEVGVSVGRGVEEGSALGLILDDGDNPESSEDSDDGDIDDDDNDGDDDNEEIRSNRDGEETQGGVVTTPEKDVGPGVGS